MCFITRGGRSAFLGDRIGRRPGVIVDDRGRGGRRARRRRPVHDRSAARHRCRAGRAPVRRRHRDRHRDGHRRDRAKRCCAIACSSATSTFAHDAARRRCWCRCARTARRSRRASTATPCCSTTPQTRVAPGQVVALLRRRRRARRRHRLLDGSTNRRECGGVRGLHARTRRRGRSRRAATSASCVARRRGGRGGARTTAARVERRTRSCRPGVPSRRSSTPGFDGDRAEARPTRSICSRRINTGSTSASGSTTTTPGRDEHEPPHATSECSERASTNASAKPTTVSDHARDVALVREQERSDAHARRRSTHTASGTGPRNSASGMRSGNRISSPYASALPAACATGADSANAAATMHDVTASAAAPPLAPRDRPAASTSTAAGRDDAQRGESPRSGRQQRHQTDGPCGPQQHRRDARRAGVTNRRARR